MAQDSRKSELIAQLAQARQGVSASFRGLHRDVNLLRRVETAFQRHRFAWLGGAGLIGILVSRLPRRSKKGIVDRKGRKSGTEEKVVKAGLLVTVLKIAFDLSRPLLTKWLTQRVSTYAEQRFRSGAVH